MGELFRRFRPEAALNGTSDRAGLDLGNATEAEHLHRYFLARDLCRGKSVLDVSCGDGSGSAMLAQTALHVTGIDVDEAAIDFADRNYASQNLTFLKVTAGRLPLESASVAAVTSFGSGLRFASAQSRDWQTFFSEVRRVLQSGGFLIVNSLDASLLSAPAAASNFPALQAKSDPLIQALQASFRHVVVLHQRFMTGSVVFPQMADGSPQPASMAPAGFVYEQRSVDTFESNAYLARSTSWIALASDATLPLVGPSLYIRSDPEVGATFEAQAELHRLRAPEAKFSQEEDTEVSADRQLQGPDTKTAQDSDERDLRIEDLSRKLHLLERQMESSSLLARQQSLLLRRSQLSFNAQARAVASAEELAQLQAKLARTARAEADLMMTRYTAVAIELKNVRAQLEQQTAFLDRFADILPAATNGTSTSGKQD